MRRIQTACPPCSRSVLARRTASGLTLLEMLVVFVLASLVGTLLIQGTGFFLGQYDTVKRIGREASSEALQQRWFASTVHAMVPYLAADRRFVGDSEFFQGVTIQPLRSRSGIPVAARWSIIAGEAGTAVVYAEQPSPCPSDARGGNRTATRTPRSVGWDTHSGNVGPGRGRPRLRSRGRTLRGHPLDGPRIRRLAGLRVRGPGSRLAGALARRRRAGMDSPAGQAGHIRRANRLDRDLRPSPGAGRQPEGLRVTRAFSASFGTPIHTHPSVDRDTHRPLGHPSRSGHPSR